MLVLSIAFSTAQYGQQLRRTRGEQALLRQALSIWGLHSRRGG